MSFVSDADLNRFIQERVNIDRERLGKYRKQVNNLRDELTDQLKLHPELKLKKMLGSGSLAKHTATSELNDIDVAVYLRDFDPQQTSTTTLLTELRRMLIIIYAPSGKKPEDFEIGTSNVRVRFHGTGLDVDVVPVIWDSKSTCDEGWVVRDAGVLLKTCIPRHVEFVKEQARKHDRYRELVRVSKWWKCRHDVPLKSFVIELIWAWLAQHNRVPASPIRALEEFFDFLSDKELLRQAIVFGDYYDTKSVVTKSGRVHVFDPANPANNVVSGLDDYDALLGKSKLDVIQEHASDASALISEAQGARTETRALDCWAKVLGPGLTTRP